MLARYPAGALLSGSKVPSPSGSGDSIPTSANQEDHVSMGTIAARKAAQVVRHAQQVIGVELICAAQALEFCRSAQPGAGTRAAYEGVRSVVPPLAAARVLAAQLAPGYEQVRTDELVTR